MMRGFVLPAVILCAVLVFPLVSLENSAPENGAGEHGTVYEILRKWIAAENALVLYTQGTADKSMDNLSRALDETAAAIEDFKGGYVYRSYLLSSFSLSNRVDGVMGNLADIKAALGGGGGGYKRRSGTRKSSGMRVPFGTH
jgi:hypothetical protein